MSPGSSYALVLRTAVAGLALSICACQAEILVRVSAIANLVYQLDCVSHVAMACGGREDFEHLWQERFEVALDDRRLSRWRDIQHRNDPGRLLRAALESASRQQFEQAIAPTLTESDRQELRAMLDDWQPSFDSWWRDVQPQVERESERIAAMLARAEVHDAIRDTEALFGVKNAPGIALQAIYRPGPVRHSTAQLIGSTGVAEIWTAARPEAIVPVFVHEYCHYLWAELPPQQVTVAERAATAQDRSGSGYGAWVLLQEALPTALGNGRIGRVLLSPEDGQRYLERKRSLYADDDIDAAAKALLPIVDDLVASHGTIATAAFAKRYVEAVQARLGARLTRPQVLLRIMAAGFDSAIMTSDAHMELFRNAFHKGSPFHSMWTETAECCGALFTSQLREQPNIAHVAVVTASHVREASFMPKALQEELEHVVAHSPAAYAVWNEDGLPRVVIAVRDKDGLAAVYRALASREALIEGVFDVAL